MRQRREGLDVVDDGRLRVEAFHGRERGLDTRHAALAFETLDERALFTADVRAGAAVDDDLEIESRALDVGAEESLGLGVGNRLVEPFVAEGELAAEVDEREVTADRKRSDRDAFDERVRIQLDEHPILERGRLAFVGVDHEVAGEGVRGEEGPLGGRREPGTTAAAQT